LKRAIVQHFGCINGKILQALAQNMFTILSLLSTNLGKEQLFGKVVTTKVSLSSLQAIHGKEQLFNLLHAIGDKVKHS
jgi:hypothetical protein